MTGRNSTNRKTAVASKETTVSLPCSSAMMISTILFGDVVKPTVKTATGYDLIEMRDVATAGVIDNIMRTRIREAKFVIVDLTHGNQGAYWEAGYAEGLGKPVIYICEKTIFDTEKTHFDTNHCTTVPWSRDDDDCFKQQLAATLRRSLDLSG